MADAGFQRAEGQLREPSADRYAIIVQEPGAGPILAAGFL
jgi:hypothetical protein